MRLQIGVNSWNNVLELFDDDFVFIFGIVILRVFLLRLFQFGETTRRPVRSHNSSGCVP